MNIIDQLYTLRREFVIVGLTGRTGSGCTTVAEILATKNFGDLRTNHQEKNDKEITNDSRKDEIIYNFLKSDGNWLPFDKIIASDIIFLYALQQGFGIILDQIIDCNKIHSGAIEENLKGFHNEYEGIHKNATKCMNFLNKKEYQQNFKKDDEENRKKHLDSCKVVWEFIKKDVHDFRDRLTKSLTRIDGGIMAPVMQKWGNNVRKFDSILEGAEPDEKAPACLARTIKHIAKTIREINKIEHRNTRIAIDALRNPFEILYFRERFSAFYTISVNTAKEIRYKNLRGRMNDIQIKNLDANEDSKSDFGDSYQNLDVNRCIELSDIFLSHDGTSPDKNRELVNNLVRYVALILHPGLIPPTPYERVMQIAYTAKLNSGCLSRQVGAAVTDDSFSVKAVGWNTVPEGQTPCSLRSLFDLVNDEDRKAYSEFERNDKTFTDYTKSLKSAYEDKEKANDNQCILCGLGLPYCFKDIYTSAYPKQRGNQVHTRSLHAEENSFLQLGKYGSTGIKGGKLFTTASCCELCGKKAYQLGIREIYYIDSYPGITQDHILSCGVKSPKMILFNGAIGRAYISLYEPFLPLKDEIKERSGINPKSRVDFEKYSKMEKAVEVIKLDLRFEDGQNAEQKEAAANELIAQFTDKIKAGEISTWIIDSDGDLTPSRDDWKNAGWLRMTVVDAQILITFIPTTKKVDQDTLKGILIGRIMASLCANFPNQIANCQLL